jgi:hypothetical protein
VFLAAVLAAHAQKGLPRSASTAATEGRAGYGHSPDVAEKIFSLQGGIAAKCMRQNS